MKKFLLSFAALALSLTMSAQWPDSTDEAVRMSQPGQSDYGCQVAFSPDGTTYVVKIVPYAPGEAGLTTLSYRLYILDKNGVLKSPEEGIEIATKPNRSWTAVNNQVYADHDGNAIVMVCDSRDAPAGTTDQGYYIYKVNPEGEILWTQSLVDGEVYELPVSICCAQNSDGDYIFAFTAMSYGDAPAPIILEKLDKDTGEGVWLRTLEHETRPYAYPHLVSSTDGNVMLFYAYTSNQYIYAKMINRDGDDVWESDTRVYRGGFDTTPIHTHIKSFEGPDGGGLFSWRDDRFSEGCFTSYLSYIKADGEYGFPNETNALKICYDDNNTRRSSHVVWSEKHNCFYAALQAFNQGSQSYQMLYVQKISKEGELLWGQDGVELEPLVISSIYDNPVVKVDDEGNPVIFYMKTYDIYTYQTNEITQCAVKLDADGNRLWDESVTFDTHKSYKTDLNVSDLIDGKYWVVAWADNRDGAMKDGSDNIYATRFNVDGTVGDPDKNGISTVSDLPAKSSAYFDLTGRRVASPTKGVYIVDGQKKVMR